MGTGPDPHRWRRRLLRWWRLFAAALILSGCDTLAIPTTTTSDVLPPPDLMSNSVRSSLPKPDSVPLTDVASQPVRDYFGSLPDGTAYLASLVGGEDEHITGINGGFVLDIGERTIPVGEVSFRMGGGLGSAFSGGTYRSNTGEWTVEVRLSEATLGSLGDAAPETVMGSISTETLLGMPVLLLDGPFRWDHEQFPVEVIYETFLVRRSCGDLALICSGSELLQLIPAGVVYEDHPLLTAIPDGLASLDGRSVRVTLGQSSAPR